MNPLASTQSDLTDLQSRLGYRFRDVSLLRLALTHPSIAHERAGRADHNQRLEFLGDAVLQLVITRELYARFPNFDEGRLTKARARLVNRRTLAQHARQLGLGAHLILSRGEEQSGGRDRPSALADAFEALVGAMFLDAGLEAAGAFLLRQFESAFEEVRTLPSLDNPKGELQELLQARSGEAPQYHLVSVSGPDHDRVFECTVNHGGVELARGRGKSKQAAESEAALAALRKLRAQSAAPAESPPPTGTNADRPA